MKFFTDIETFNKKDIVTKTRVIVQNFTELSEGMVNLEKDFGGKKIFKDTLDKLDLSRKLISDAANNLEKPGYINESLKNTYSLLLTVNANIENIKNHKSAWLLSDDTEPKRAISCPAAIEEKSFEEKHAIINPHLKFEY